MKPDFSPKTLRKHILKMAMNAQCGHIACAFSIVEILSALYGQVMKYDRDDPKSPNRDYLVLSKGHGVMALYACFRELGWLTDADLENYMKDGSKLHGLAESQIPGIEATTGSLGHGLPIAVGLALGLKYEFESKQRVFCIVGDGEMQEGSNWEAIQFAAHHRLDNLTVIVDENGWQAMGRPVDILGYPNLVDKFQAFGWDAFQWDGHDVTHMASALKKGANPQALIAMTDKGCGISFMENENSYHYKRLTKETFEAAMKELGYKNIAGRPHNEWMR